MDGLVAGAANHEGLTPFLGHEDRPRGLAWTGFSQAGEFADLVDNHLAGFLAQLAPLPQEPDHQFFAGVGRSVGMRSVRRATRRRLAVRR